MKDIERERGKESENLFDREVCGIRHCVARGADRLRRSKPRMSSIEIAGTGSIIWLTIVSIALLFIILRFVAFSWRDDWHKPWLAILRACSDTCGCCEKKEVKVNPLSPEALAKRGLSSDLIANKMAREGDPQ